MKNNKNKCWLWRVSFYLMGLVILSIGLTLNTKSGLGVSPIISVPFSIANILNLNFATVTFIVYTIFVLLQFIIKGKNRDIKDIFQIPFSLMFGILLNLFGIILDFNPTTVWQSWLLLFGAIIGTAVGVSMLISMKLISNPADALAQAVGDLLKKDPGFGKNVLDITCVCITCTIGLVLSGKIVGIGIGTLICMIAVGRVIAVFNRIFKEGMLKLAGLQVVDYSSQIERVM
ncbi:MAG: YitT family protein [Intestinibacter sp.]